MKRGQATIFIIGGVVLISFLVFFFLFKGKIIPPKLGSKETNPNLFLESCIEKKTKEAIKIMAPQGGYINPEFSFKFKFSDGDFQNISYLCYTQNYYIPCINQEPMLIEHLKKEIKDYIAEDVENCFDSFISDLKEQNYEVNSSYSGFDIELAPKKILVKIYGEIITEKTGETLKRENFEVRIPTKIYDLAIVAQEIISQEAEYCHFDQVGFMILNPKFELNKFKTGDSDIIYTIIDKDSKEEFRFAVRSCVIPPGM